MSCDCLARLREAAIRANLRNHSSRFHEELTDILDAAIDNRGPYAAPREPQLHEQVQALRSPRPITPADCPDAGALERGGVWHLSDKSYSDLCAWEKWAREIAVPLIETGAGYNSECRAAFEARPKE